MKERENVCDACSKRTLARIKIELIRAHSTE